MRPGIRIGIGLILAAITFAVLTAFAKPLYTKNSWHHHCWYGDGKEHEPTDSTKTDY